MISNICVLAALCSAGKVLKTPLYKEQVEEVPDPHAVYSMMDDIIMSAYLHFRRHPRQNNNKC